jgi:hypothetical protein
MQQRAEIRHPKPADPLADVNDAIAKEGECTRASEQDTLRRESSHHQQFYPPTAE